MNGPSKFGNARAVQAGSGAELLFFDPFLRAWGIVSMVGVEFRFGHVPLERPWKAGEFDISLMELQGAKPRIFSYDLRTVVDPTTWPQGAGLVLIQAYCFFPKERSLRSTLG